MFSNSRICEVLKLLSRKNIEEIIEKNKGDRYSKKLSTWQQMVTMIVAQLSGCTSLRDIELLLDRQQNNFYHMGLGSAVKRSTLSDSNKKRDAGIFKSIAELTISRLSEKKKHLKNVVSCIDSSIIRQESRGNDWSKGSRRGSKGLKLHVAYDSTNDQIEYAEVTDANINDITAGKKMHLDQDKIYVFDKGYSDYNWWKEIHDAGSFFVTRLKKNANYKVIEKREVKQEDKDFIKKDELIELSNKAPRGGKKNNLHGITLRLISVKHPDPKRKDPLIIVSNNLDDEADVISGWYKKRWGVELVFKWLKQNLKLKKFIGESRNAVLIQVYVAIICYVLMKMYQASSEIFRGMRLKDIAVLLKNSLFEREALTVKRREKRPPGNENQYTLFEQNSFAR